jgi:hypothetical protein
MSEEENEQENKYRTDDSYEAEAQVPMEEDEEQGLPLSEYELNEVIESLCLSKADEFKLIGYDHVSGKEVWDCISDRYRKQGIPALHQIVNDILSLKSTQFMNWMTMSAYKGAQF